MKFGLRTSFMEADFRKLSQSARDLGEKSFVPTGQLFLSLLRLVSMQFSHFTKAFGEKGPSIVTRVHLQVLGLPVAGVVEISTTPVHSLAPIMPLAKGGSG
jgi:hypothetical protein